MHHPTGSLAWHAKYRVRLAAIVALLAYWFVAPLPLAEAAEFQFWYANTGRTGEAIEALCADFNARQKNHRVRCVGQGSYELAMQKAIAAYRAGKQPAIVQFYEVGTLDVLMSGAMYPVHQLMSDMGYGVDWGAYLHGVRDYYASSDGRLNSLPFNASTLVLFANDDKLKAAGVAQAPETWEAFESALIRLRAKGESCPFAFELHPWWHLEQFSAIHGLPIASAHNGYDSLQPEYLFDRTLHLRMMQDLKRWYDQGMARLPHQLAAGNMIRAFSAGECALLVSSSGNYSSVRAGAEAAGFHVSVHPAPRYDGFVRHNTLVGGASLWVMKGFERPVYSGVAAFFEYLRRPDIQLRFTRSTGFLPVTAPARELSNAEAKLDPAFATVAVGMDSLDQAGNADTRGVRLGFYARFRSLWTEEMQKAFAGDQSVKQALTHAKQRGDILLRRFARIYQGEVVP